LLKFIEGGVKAREGIVKKAREGIVKAREGAFKK
jgi:hypothetical protein